MKKLLLTLCLTSLLAAPVWATEQAIDTDDLRSPDQVSDKYENQKVPGEPQDSQAREPKAVALCEGGACPN